MLVQQQLVLLSSAVSAGCDRLQVLASGFVVNPHSYLRSCWNVMDGGLVVLSLFDVAVSLSATQGQRNSLGILRVFRLLRTLRPLRSVSSPLSAVPTAGHWRRSVVKFRGSGSVRSNHEQGRRWKFLTGVQGQGSGDGSPIVGSRGKTPRLGDKVPQNLKHF